MTMSLILSAILAITLSLGTSNVSNTATQNERDTPTENSKGINPVQHSE